MTLAGCTLHPSSLLLSAHLLPLPSSADCVDGFQGVGSAVPTGSSHSSLRSCHLFLAGAWTRGLPLRQILSLEREPQRLSLVSVRSRPIICGHGAGVTLVLQSLPFCLRSGF